MKDMLSDTFIFDFNFKMVAFTQLEWTFLKAFKSFVSETFWQGITVPVREKTPVISYAYSSDKKWKIEPRAVGAGFGKPELQNWVTHYDVIYRVL